MTEIRELAEILREAARSVPMEIAAEESDFWAAAEALTSLSSQVEALKAERANLIETKREQIARLTRDNEMNSMRASTAEAERDNAIAKWEAADGMDGAVVDAIRTILRESGVPQAAFIDDHVANAIVERNIAVGKAKAAETRVAVLEEALRIAEAVLRNAPSFETTDGGKMQVHSPFTAAARARQALGET